MRRIIQNQRSLTLREDLKRQSLSEKNVGGDDRWSELSLSQSDSWSEVLSFPPIFPWNLSFSFALAWTDSIFSFNFAGSMQSLFGFSSCLWLQPTRNRFPILDPDWEISWDLNRLSYSANSLENPSLRSSQYSNSSLVLSLLSVIRRFVSKFFSIWIN